jgi:hypothetical protein
VSLSTAFDHTARTSPKATSDAGASGAEFLKLLDPDGIHNVVAICPETKAIEARTFPPDSFDAIQRWVDQRNGRLNIYYSPNEVRPTTGDVKPSKTNFAAIRAVYIDLDPDKTKELEGERKRLATEIERLETDPLHAPTFTIDTGGGYQALWLLDKKLPAAEAREAVEAQGRGLALALGGDHVQDISRLLRLPGTKNLPDARKRAAGRVKAPAVLREATGERFPLEWLADIAAPVAGAPNANKDADKDIATAIAEIEGAEFAGVAAIEDLPQHLLQRFQAALIKEPSINELWSGDTPPADASGSGYLFALAAKLHAVGGFSPIDLAQLAGCWPITSGKEYDARAIARAWVRSRPAPRPSAEEEFEAEDVAALPDNDGAALGIATLVPFTPTDIPLRRWVVGSFLIRGALSALIAPAGAGKTTYLAALALAIASGRGDLVGMEVKERTRVLLWNQEDPEEESKRRVLALMQGFGLSWDDLRIDGRIAIDLGSGASEPLLISRKLPDGSIVQTPQTKRLRRYIATNAIGVAIFDPFVEMHDSEENANNEVAPVARIFRSIATQAGCSVAIAHHTKKPSGADSAGQAGNMDTARGASALMGVARTAMTLFTLDGKTGQKDYGLTEDEARRYVRVDDAKNNMAFKNNGGPLFFKREGVTLETSGEDVGILRPTQLAKVATSKKDERDTLTQDVLAALEGHSARPIVDIAAELVRQPFYSDDTEHALRLRIKRLIPESGRPVGGGRLLKTDTRKPCSGGGRAAFVFVAPASDHFSE